MIAQVILNGILAGALIGLLALGFTLVVRTARIIHIAHAATYATGGYIGLYLLRTYGTSPFMAACGAMVAAALVSLLVEWGIYRPLRKRNASSLSVFLASLAVVVIVQNAIGLVFGNEINVAQTNFGQGIVSLWGGRITVWQVISILVSASAFCLTSILLQFTKTGKLARAVGSDADLSRVTGVNLDKVLLKMTLYSAVLGGLAGYMIAYDRSITPSSGLNLILLAITAAIVGGVGSVPGALLGGLIVGLTRNLAGWQLPSQWQDAIVFILLLVVLTFRPQGIFGRPMKKSTA